MKIREEDLELGGWRLKRYLFTPDSPEDIRAAALLYHGQGDYSARYDETMEVFTRQGIACVATDLPGHGGSEGKRGRVPGFELIDRITQSNLKLCRDLCPEEQGPLGILGHSAGGLMALRELLLRSGPYSFSWISSPLIRPEANQHPILVRFAPVIARLLPGLTMGTGVTLDDCVHAECRSEPAPEDDGQLFHARVSLGWGYAMMVAAGEVRARLISDPPALSLLLTQGSADPVCPPQYLREVLARTRIPNLHYHEFPGALHEPFADCSKAELFAAVSVWLNETLGKTDSAQTSPSG